MKIVAGEGKKERNFGRSSGGAVRRRGGPARSVRVWVVRGGGGPGGDGPGGGGPGGGGPGGGGPGEGGPEVGPRRVLHRIVGPPSVGMKVVLG